MSVNEIAARLGGLLIARRERHFWVSHRGEPASSGICPERFIESCRTFLPGSMVDKGSRGGADIEKLSSACGRQAAESSNQDDGRFTLLAMDYNAFEPLDWHTDPQTNYRWSNGFYRDLQLYNLPNGADVKYPWELSRHQFLFELAAGWWSTGNDRSAEAVRSHLLDWIAQNPLYQGVNWTSGLEVGMRSISWMWTMAALGDWQGWRADDIERIATSLGNHACYLSDHFSYHSSPYNHLIGEATALLLMASILTEHRRATAWQAQSIKALKQYGSSQFYADGFSVEQAISYHFYTLGLLTMALVAARRLEVDVDLLEATVHKAFLTGIQFRRPDGRWPAVGDLDSARACPVRPKDFWNFDSLCACGAVLFDDPALVAGQSEPGPELFWLFGADGIERWHSLFGSRSKSLDNGQAVVQESCLHVLPDSGYVIASDSSDWLLFDAGPIAKGLFHDSTPSTAHGHADTLQVLYFSEGQAILDDSGIPFYNGDSNWIRYFRSPSAHNTLEIEGVEYVHPEGRLAWSREVRLPTLTADLSPVRWMCSGRVTWPEVTLERHILALPQQGLWIADWITTDRPRQATWHWQLPLDAPSELLDAPAPDLLACWNGQSLTRSSDSPCEVQVLRAQEGNPPGWRCHHYGEKRLGAVLTCRQIISGSSLVLTSIGKKTRPHIGVRLYSRCVAPSAELDAMMPRWKHHSCEWLLQSSRSYVPVEAGLLCES